MTGGSCGGGGGFGWSVVAIEHTHPEEEEEENENDHRESTINSHALGSVRLPSPDLDDHDHDHDHDDHDHDDHDDQQRHNEVGQGPLAGVGTFASPPNSAPRSIDLFKSPYCTVLYLCLPKSSASSWIFWQTIQTRCVSVRSCRVTFWLLLVVCFFAMFFSCLWLVSLHPVPPRL